MALTTQPGAPGPEPIDDYHVERGVDEAARPISHHAVSVVNFVLLIVLAALSLALAWVVGTLLGVI